MLKVEEEYKILPYPMVVRKSTYTDGSSCYEADCPDLPGCKGQGDSIDEAVADLQDAKFLYISSLLEDGLPVPTPSDPLPTRFEVNIGVVSSSSTQTNVNVFNARQECFSSLKLTFPERELSVTCPQQSQPDSESSVEGMKLSTAFQKLNKVIKIIDGVYIYRISSCERVRTSSTRCCIYHSWSCC